MNSTGASVHSLFRNKVQYQVPLYQRRYVWNKTNWKTLWENILDQKKLKTVGDRGHFTGPIVTRLIERQQNRFEVIDGQQRLTTFQIIFCVIRDLCSKSPSFCKFERDAEDHIKNDDIAIENLRLQDPLRDLPEPIYKFIPTDYDNLAFEKIVQREYGQAILTTSSVEEARAKVFGEEKFSHRVLDTYDYFYTVITDLEEISNEIPNLLETIKNNLDLVQITPGPSQQAEKIFESVNATGRSLSEFDYLRNNLFLRAGDKSATLYERLWFENDPDYDWSDNRLESFFQAFLMAKLGPDALNNDAKLFDVYQQKLVIPRQNVENEFENIKNFAGTYKKLDVDPDMLDVDPEFETRMQFYEDLRAYENEESYLDFESQHYYNVTVVRAFIMHLQEELKRPRSEILEVLEILESYIMRRMLVDTVTGRYAYNTIKAFFRNLCKPQAQEFTLDSLVEHLASGQSWISNDVVENWFKGNEYHYQSDWFAQALGFAERYIFYRIENWKRMDAGEEPLNFTAEEFPTSRKRVRTLTQLSYNEDAWASLGNLTFCWENDTRQGRNKFDKKNSWGNEVNRKLKLNSEIYNKPGWDLNEIHEREQELFLIFRKIWKENSIIEKRREDIKKKYQVGSEVLGRVVNIVKFGVFVELELGIDGLVHVSEMAWTSRKIEPAEIVSEDQSVTVKILEISEKEQRIRLSLKQMQPDPWVEAAEKYKVGSVVPGRIVELTGFGAFAELGEGIEGLIHISELAYRRIKKPEEIVSVGDELDLKVIELDPTERRISLSLKATQPDPWVKASEKYKVGSVVPGRIVKLTHYGAFVELEEGIRGLIYNSELAHRHIKSPNQVVSVGQELDLKVIRLDRKARGIRLSLKQTQHDPWVEVCGKYKVGSVVRGKIVDILDRGVYVELEEKIADFVHISELADRLIGKPEEIVSLGQELNLKVLGLDPEKRRIALSLKAIGKQ